MVISDINLELFQELEQKDLSVEDYILLLSLENNEKDLISHYIANDRLHIQSVQKLFGRCYINTSSGDFFYDGWYVTDSGREIINNLKL